MSEINIFRSLKKFEQDINGFGFNSLPSNLYNNNNIDLSKWTLVVTDYSIKKLIRKCRHEQDLLKNLKEDQISGKIDNESDGAMPSYNGQSNDQVGTKAALQCLDLSGGERITDIGAKYISKYCKSLRQISFENVYQLTELGLKYICQSCVQLEEVNLSGCNGISDTGFSVIGRYLSNLRILKLSGCNILQDAIAQIFEGCKLLEEINLSYSTMISDTELKILSKHCHLLRVLILIECHQVSDIGILSVSQGCKNLEMIKLKRSSLLFKITDVALLALSERCSKLKNINLSGCDMITDVGISWLLQGCPQLESINLANCSKITNSSMNAIGKGCPLLRRIILTRLKLVTDVGIRYLANGCVSLEHINLAGMLRLSNEKRSEFGYEGLQALGKSNCAQSVNYLNLHGCFQLSTAALKSISMLANLKVLVLSACTNLTKNGLAMVSASCPLINFISLASCGECIDDSVVHIITKGLKFLNHIDLSKCGRIGRSSIVSLSKCRGLVHLNLSYNQYINDNAMLCLYEAIFSPGLQTLCLSSCDKITDTSLAWIADGFKEENGDMSLLTLSLQGTKITSHGLASVRDRFLLSEVKNNSSFFGFFPLPRASDRKMMNVYAREYRAATKLQSKFRSFQAKKSTLILKQIYCRKKVALLLQSLWRGNQDRLMLRQKLEQMKNEIKSALKIQTCCRIMFAKLKIQQLRYELWMAQLLKATRKIQSVWRGNQGRKLAKYRFEERILFHEMRKKASTKIQTLVRSTAARCARNRLYQLKIELEISLFKNARTIQLFWRITRSKRRRNILVNVRNEIRSKQRMAASTIFKFYRQNEFRLLINELIEKTKTKNISAIKIQCFWRVVISYQQKLLLQNLFNKQNEHKAAIIIQQGLRRMIAMTIVANKRESALKVKILKKENAIVIRRWCRQVLAQIKTERMKEKREKCIRENFELELMASTKIAAFWRGIKGRELKQIKILEKKAQWKKMWSDEDDRYFFYNQVTGETRWRKPQALLDLDPRPICSNCSFYESKVECANCVEFFCLQCWDAVHFGGKRAYHKFRCLYDFYGKRIDYGDGEFPSMWPTEIEQDEKNGWQLRVNPLRENIAQEMNWETYIDEKSKRYFYYNSITKQYTYDYSDIENVIKSNKPYIV